MPAGLLTGSTPGARRADLLGKLASGELSLIVGTHALIEDGVRFARLGVAVVDEQHRFGVRQRAALDAKGPEDDRPHVLHMTATPIPRTLALLGYGDLDFTLLRERPRGRRPVQTFVCATERERGRAYERIREELRAGRQAFVVCPLVEESEALQARAATAEFERLRDGELRDFRVVLMHGQLRPAAKQEAMAQFASGGADVLVATSVIEVGIDVPNATVMLVEDADRYGISQLHQLRGRIGRGEHPSLCMLFGAKDSPRLRALAQSTRRVRAGRDRPASCAARASSSAPGSTGSPSSGSPSCRETPSCSSGRGSARGRSSTTTASCRSPRTRCWRRRWSAPTAPRPRRRSGREPRAVCVRVIAGRFGGRTLVAPRGRATRPTSDRVREALFSILGSVDGARVLDLFAGSGALAIEALSRGAAEATLVDSSAAAIAAIRRNLDAVGATAEVRRQRATALPRAGT